MLFSVQEPINRIWIIKHLREQLKLPLLEAKSRLEFMLVGNLLEVPAFYPTSEYVDHLNRMGITVAIDIHSTDNTRSGSVNRVDGKRTDSIANTLSEFQRSPLKLPMVNWRSKPCH